MRTKTLIIGHMESIGLPLLILDSYYETGLGKLCGGGRREGLRWDWREGEGQAMLFRVCLSQVETF